jgi:hypothetical protein
LTSKELILKLVIFIVAYSLKKYAQAALVTAYKNTQSDAAIASPREDPICIRLIVPGNKNLSIVTVQPGFVSIRML